LQPLLANYLTPLGLAGHARADAGGDAGLQPPLPPTTCCMSGCANCVWDVYAEDLRNWQARTKDGGPNTAESDAASALLNSPELASLNAFAELERRLKTGTA